MFDGEAAAYDAIMSGEVSILQYIALRGLYITMQVSILPNVPHTLSGEGRTSSCHKIRGTKRKVWLQPWSTEDLLPFTYTFLPSASLTLFSPSPTFSLPPPPFLFSLPLSPSFLPSPTPHSNSPGMPEMLSPSAALVGAGLGKMVALVTDGRFSGASHGERHKSSILWCTMVY